MTGSIARRSHRTHDEWTGDRLWWSVEALSSCTPPQDARGPGDPPHDDGHGRRPQLSRQTRRMRTPHSNVARFIRANGGALSYRQLDAGGIPRSAVSAAIYCRRDRPSPTRLVHHSGCPARRRSGCPSRRSAHRGIRGSPRRSLVARRSAPAREGPERLPDGSEARTPRTTARPRPSWGLRPLPLAARRRPAARDPLPIALAEMLTCARATRRDRGDGLGAVSSERSRSRGPCVGARIRAVRPGGISSIAWTRARPRASRRSSACSSGPTASGTGSRSALAGVRSGRPAHRRPTRHRGRRRAVPHRPRVRGRPPSRTSSSSCAGTWSIRLSYRMVLNEWDAVCSGILQLVARGEHRWGCARSASIRPPPVPLRGLDQLAFA